MSSSSSLLSINMISSSTEAIIVIAANNMSTMLWLRRPNQSQQRCTRKVVSIQKATDGKNNGRSINNGRDCAGASALNFIMVTMFCVVEIIEILIIITTIIASDGGDAFCYYYLVGRCRPDE